MQNDEAEAEPSSDIHTDVEIEPIDNTISETTKQETKWYLYLLPFALAVLSHILFGLHPVFSRYLQRTVGGDQVVPPLSLPVVGYFFVLVLYSPRMAYKLVKHCKSQTAYQRIDRDLLIKWMKLFKSDFLLNGKLWLFIIVTIGRAVTNILSSRFTSAIFVQLFALLTPFLVTLFSWVIYRNSNHQEKLSWQMFAALFVTVIGSMLIILGGVNDNKDRVWYQFLFTYNIDWRTLGLTSTDLLGIGMSIAAATCLAAYMVIVKSLKSSGSASAFLTDGENMFIFQTVFIALILLVPSLILEDWSVYLRLSWYNWGMFMLFIILVLLIANLVSILCIQSIGATTVGSILSLRLVSAIIFSAIILHENLSTLWQVIGSIIVLASVSVFLFWQQKRLSRPEAKTPIQEEQVELEAVTENQSTMEEENDNIRLTQEQENETA